MKRIAFGAFLLVFGCGGSDDAPPTLCEQAQQKNDSCGIKMAVACSSLDAAPEEIKTATKTCLIDQDCSDWGSYIGNQFMSASAIMCFGQHGVQLTGMFLCVDGSGAVAEQDQCDGAENCADGSDESGC